MVSTKKRSIGKLKLSLWGKFSEKQLSMQNIWKQFGKNLIFLDWSILLNFLK